MYRIFILFFCTLIALSSCNIESVTTINADGSGYAQNVIIMDDELKGMIEMMGAMEGGENPLLDDSGDSSSEDAFGPEQIFTQLFEGDTTITFAQMAMEDSVEISQDNLDLLSKMSIGINEGEISINYHYDNTEEANKLFYLLGNMDSLEKEVTIDLDKVDIPNYVSLDAENGILRVSGNPLVSGGSGSALGEAGEMDEMTKLMFADSKVSVVYVLPGKVEFLNFPDATIDGNKAMITYDLLETMEMDEVPELVIKYKPLINNI